MHVIVRGKMVAKVDRFHKHLEINVFWLTILSGWRVFLAFQQFSG